MTLRTAVSMLVCHYQVIILQVSSRITVHVTYPCDNCDFFVYVFVQPTTTRVITVRQTRAPLTATRRATRRDAHAQSRIAYHINDSVECRMQVAWPASDCTRGRVLAHRSASGTFYVCGTVPPSLVLSEERDGTTAVGGVGLAVSGRLAQDAYDQPRDAIGVHVPRPALTSVSWTSCRPCPRP